VARLYWELAYQYAWDNQMARAEELSERGLSFIGPEPSVARCQLLAAKGMNAGGREHYDVWADSVEEAITIAEEIGEDRILGAEILQAKMYLGEHWLRGRMHAETADRALELVRRVGTPWDLSGSIGVAIIGYAHNHRFEDVDALWKEGLDLAVAYGDIGNEMHAKVFHAIVECYRGNLEEAHKWYTGVAQWARETDFAWATIIIEGLAMVEFWKGNWDTARRLAEEINRSPIVGTMAGMEPSFALLLMAYLGEREAAMVRMEELRPRLAIAGRYNQIGSWFATLCTLEASAVLGMREACAALYPLAVQLDEDGTHIVWSKGLTERYAAIAAAAGGHWDLAGKHFASAEGRAQGGNDRLELAELTRWRAQMLLWRDEAGDRAQARELAAVAGRAYREMGMTRHVGLTEEMTISSLSDG
jgi:hypothetical protein